MSTNAIIKVEGITTVKVYKHWDGYPEATLPWLEAFNKKFTKERGNDLQYKFAQLLRSSYRDADEFELDKSEFTGWGVIGYEDCTFIAYIYTLNMDGTVTVEHS